MGLSTESTVILMFQEVFWKNRKYNNIYYID